MPSPVVKRKKKVIYMDFNGAINAIMRGERVTRMSWDNKGHYCLLKDGLLSLHKAGESEHTIHSWIVNDGDIMGDDWIVIESLKN